MRSVSNGLQTLLPNMIVLPVSNALALRIIAPQITLLTPPTTTLQLPTLPTENSKQLVQIKCTEVTALKATASTVAPVRRDVSGQD
jgi:hypothetical protein